MIFWQLKRADLDIAPTSPAHATVWWFMYGVNPYRVVMAAYGEAIWCLPKPFMPLFMIEASFSRSGEYVSEGKE